MIKYGKKKKAGYVYQGMISIVCEYRIWLLCILLVLAVILESSSIERCIWYLQLFQILPQTMCIIHGVRTYLFMCTPLKLTRRHGGEKNICENEPLGFHHGDCFRLIAWNRSVLGNIERNTDMHFKQRARGSSMCASFFFSWCNFFLIKNAERQ